MAAESVLPLLLLLLVEDMAQWPAKVEVKRTTKKKAFLEALGSCLAGVHVIALQALVHGPPQGAAEQLPQQQ